MGLEDMEAEQIHVIAHAPHRLESQESRQTSPPSLSDTTSHRQKVEFHQPQPFYPMISFRTATLNLARGKPPRSQRLWGTRLVVQVSCCFTTVGGKEWTAG
jgi:hypothetical protein